MSRSWSKPSITLQPFKSWPHQCGCVNGYVVIFFRLQGVKDYVGQDLAKAPRVADMPDSFGCLGEGVPDQTKKNMWRNSEEIRYLPQPSNNSHSGIAMNRPKWWFSNGEDGEWPNWPQIRVVKNSEIAQIHSSLEIYGNVSSINGTYSSYFSPLKSSLQNWILLDHPGVWSSESCRFFVGGRERKRSLRVFPVYQSRIKIPCLGLFVCVVAYEFCWIVILIVKYLKILAWCMYKFRIYLCNAQFQSITLNES